VDVKRLVAQSGRGEAVEERLVVKDPPGPQVGSPGRNVTVQQQGHRLRKDWVLAQRGDHGPDPFPIEMDDRDPKQIVEHVNGAHGIRELGPEHVRDPRLRRDPALIPQSPQPVTELHLTPAS